MRERATSNKHCKQKNAASGTIRKPPVKSTDELTVGRLMDTSQILHILRNPYGYSPDKIKEAQLAACDKLERTEHICHDVECPSFVHGVCTFGCKQGFNRP